MKLAVEHTPSPNHGERAPGKAVDMLILHYTGMIPDERALKWLMDPESAVSCHYFVFEDGRITRLVEEDRRAWHAGQSYWAGETDINSRSIGVEIANPGHEFGYRAFPAVQIEAAIALCADIIARHRIPADRVLAHSDVAPARKEDPGELFPWEQLHRAGIGHWVPPEPLSEGISFSLGERNSAVAALKNLLRSYGYGAGEGDEYDEVTKSVVAALQRHFRPERVDGVADLSTIRTLERLAAMRRN